MAKGHNPHIEFGFGLWLRLARRFRVAVIAFWCAMAALGLWLSLSLLGVNTDTSDMIDAAAPYRVAQAEFEEAFPGLNNQILLIVRADSPDGLAIYSQELAQALSLSDQVNQVSHPPSDPFFQKNGLLYLDTNALEDQLAQLTEAAPLIERLSQSPTNETLFETLIQLVERGEGNENADGLLLGVADTLAANMEGRRQALSWQKAFGEPEAGPYQTIIVLDPILDHTRVRAAAPIQELIEQLTEQISERTQITAEVFVTGNPVLRADELKSVSEGIGLAFLISFVVVGVVLLFALRSPLLVFFVLFSLIISILITAGLAALIYGELNLVSVAFTVLMVGLGVDFAIHLLMHLQSKRNLGLSVPATLYRTSRGIGTALVLTAPSTALAFLAFVPTKFVGISQLGVVAAIGVIIAFLVATSLLTAIFSYLPIKPQRHKKATASRQKNGEVSGQVSDEVSGEVSGHAKQFTFKPAHRNYLAIGVILLGFGALALMPRAQFDADPMALRNQDAASVKAFELLFESPTTAPYSLSVLAENSDEINALTTQLTALESVDSVRSLQGFIPKDQYDKLDLIGYAAIGLEFALYGEGDAPATTADPAAHLQKILGGRDGEAARALSAALTPWIEAVKQDPALWDISEQDLFLYWPYQQERLRAQIQADFVGVDDLPDAISRRYKSTNNLERLEIIPANDVRDSELRRDFVAQVTAAAPKATGSARSVQDAGDIVQASMIRAIIVALLAVSILLFYVVRNIKLVLIMLVPLMLAGLLTTATGILISLPYNFANVIVLPLLIGIGVDSSLHLALQTQKKPHITASVFDNITPRAVIFSAVTTIASFGSLSFSAHRGTASMGLLLMIAISWVLICTLLVTPALLDWTSRKGEAKS